MGQPVIVQVTGAVTLSPAAAGCPPMTLFETMSVYVNAAYAASKSGRPGINNPTFGSPYVIPLEGVAKVRFLYFRTSIPMVIYLTSPNGGADQALPCSDEVVLHNPGAGTELTSIKVVGIGDIDYVLAGDPA